jgi:organic radical activating enzyme
MTVTVNQIIYQTVQGEGHFLGTPSSLIRVVGCNLKCPWCDTPWTWDGSTSKDITDENIQVIDKYYKKLITDIVSNKGNCKNVMITGGEPFLHSHDNNYQKFIYGLIDHYDTAEIETNGTLLTKNEEFLTRLCEKPVKFNISPKPTVIPKSITNKYMYLKEYAEMICEAIEIIDSKSNFNQSYELKFVYSKTNEPELVKFIEALTELNSSITKHITVMPFTPNKAIWEEIWNTAPFVSSKSYPKNYSTELKQYYKSATEFCLKHGYRLTPRLHMFIFDNNNELI